MNVLFVVYDNGSRAHEFPLNLAYLSSVLIEAGHKVTIYEKNVFHYDSSHLTSFLDNNSFDLVGLSLCAGYWQYKEFLEISRAINNSINRGSFSYVLGGHMFGAKQEYFLRKGNADFVVLGEGERTIVELCAVLGKVGLEYLSQVNGLVYLKDGLLYQTKAREQIENLDSIPFPAWDLFEIQHYVMTDFPGFKRTDRLMPVLSSRGCPYSCSFCFRYMSGIRFRSPDNVIEEIKLLKEKYHITGIVFHDECFLSGSKRTEEICDLLIKENLGIRFTCDGRLNFAKPDTLKLMKKAGCIFINYGIESFDNEVLKNMHKNLDTKTIEKGLQNTRDVGIHMGINVIFGNIGDTYETLMKGVDLTLKYTDHAYQRTIRPVTPYPGSELYSYALKKRLIDDIADFYENKHKNSDLLTVNFTELSDAEFYRALYEANTILLNDQIEFDKRSYDEIMKKMYFEGDSSFRGFRQS